MSFNAKQFRHFSMSWQALREASVRCTTKIGRHFCRQGISKAGSSYDLHKSAFPRISAKVFHAIIFPCTILCRFCTHAFVFAYFFMQRLSERLSLHLSLFTWTLFHNKHTEHVRQSKNTKTKSVHLPFAPACASCTWTEVSPVSRIPIFRLSYSIQEQLQHSGCVTASWVA